MSWKKIALHGATSLSRVCGEYEVIAPKVPYGGRFRIKVLETTDGPHPFFASSNVSLKTPKGDVDWLAAYGPTEEAAVEKVLAEFMEKLAARDNASDDDFEWSDPNAF